jgi:PST family polysaccharide transporter
MKNMTWLTVLQFANYLVPLLIIPYVVRKLGVEVFGSVSYTQNIISYLTIIVNFGFEYSATQEIALNKGNQQALCQVFWSVIRFKSFLLLLSFVVLIFLGVFFDKVSGDKMLYLYGSLINIGVVLFPTWFFQGIETMSKMTIFNFLIKIIGAVFTILLINNAADYRLYILIPSLAYIVIGVFAFAYIIRKYNLYPLVKENLICSSVVRKGFPIFLNNIFATLYTIAGMTILGLYISDHQLGIYSGANKIIVAFIMFTSIPISISLFPAMSRKFETSLNDGIQFFKKTLFGVGIFGIICSLSIYITAPLLVKLILGNNFEESVSLLKLFSPLPFLVIVASMFTVQGMYGLQLQKYAPYVGATIGLFSILLNFYLIPRIGIYGAAWSYICSEMLEILIVLLILYKKLNL